MDSITRLHMMLPRGARTSGTAVAGDVLATKTFSNDNDTGIVGTMPDNGAITITPNPDQEQAIPERKFRRVGLKNNA